jgi:hypothetical protein
MHFLKIEIEEFGKLADFTLELGEGVNLVEGKMNPAKAHCLLFFALCCTIFRAATLRAAMNGISVFPGAIAARPDR